MFDKKNAVLNITAIIIGYGILAGGFQSGMTSAFRPDTANHYEHKLNFSQRLNLNTARCEETQEESNIPYDSDEIRINLEIGEAAMAAGDLEAAQTAYLQAFKLDAKSYIAVYNLGFISQMRGSINNAAAYYRLAARLDASKYEPLLNLGAALLMQKKYDEAAGSLNEALKIAPENTDIQFNIALAKLYSKKFDEAYGALKTLLSKPADKASKITNDEIILKYAAACIELKKYDEALKALNITSSQPEILIECEYLKGCAYLKSGKIKESEEALKKALDLCSKPEMSGLLETLKEKINNLRKNPAASRIIE